MDMVSENYNALISIEEKVINLQKDIVKPVKILNLNFSKKNRGGGR